MARSSKSISSAVLAALLGLGCMAAQDMPSQAEKSPSSTAIPVIFTQTLEAGKVKPGETVIARTTQVVFLPGGQILLNGTTLVGHVVESTPFVFNPAPYAVQKPSSLSIHFDTIAESGSTMPVRLSVRAISGPVASHEASILHYRDETDSTGTRTLIGGSQFSPLDSQVELPNGDIGGYNRKQGVFGRLIAGDYVSGNAVIHCETTNTEQSLGIFSASACGVYGLGTTFMPDSGNTGDGTFVLKSGHQTVKLYAGSAALLQVVGSSL